MIDLAKHRKQVAAQAEIDKVHDAAYRKLPKDSQERYRIAMQHLSDLSRAHLGKTLKAKVVKSWLYELGFDEHAARLHLWNACGSGIISFNRDYDVECGDFEALD